MTPTESQKPNYSRRFFWLAAFVVVLFGGYSVGWFYLANVVETQTKAAIAGVNRDGVTAECVNAVARGYPFRIGLFCDRVAFTDSDEGIALSAGGFRSAGQIYDPKRLVAELDGPARIDLPQSSPLALDWDGLRASVRLAQPVPERISLEGTTLKASMASGEPLATIGAFEAHMRPNGEDLDLAGSFAGLAIEQSLLDGRKLPSLSSQSDLTLNNGVEAGRLGRAEPARPIGNDQDPDGFDRSRDRASGQRAVLDREGRPARRRPESRRCATPRAFRRVLADAFPESRERIVSSFSGLAALGGAPTLPLKVVKGKASLGFIPLGEIPPL